ncbi:Transposase [Neochlamydia sp. S13]|nr:Transposase [Neochlamydia sp. S13]
MPLKACKMMGYSRDSFYRFKELYETGGKAALQDMTPRKPYIKNSVDESIEEAVVDFALQKPAYGQLRVCNELEETGSFHFARGRTFCLATI